MTGKCPERRAYHTSFGHNNRLFIHGGYDITNGTLDSLYMLDMAKVNDLENQSETSTKKMLEWWRIETNGPQKPGPLAHHSSVVFGDKMYMFGGSGPRTQAQQMSDKPNASLWTLELKTMRWDPVIPRGDAQPEARDDHTAVIYNNATMVVFGGFVDGGERTNDIWRYHFKDNRWEQIVPQTSLAPKPRAGHSASVMGSQMIVFGGRDDDNERLNDLWSFSFEQNTWTELLPKAGTPPCPRSGHSSSIYHCMLLVFGGILEVTHELNDMHAYDLSTGEWFIFYDEFGIGATLSASPMKGGMFTGHLN